MQFNQNYIIKEVLGSITASSV